MKKIMLILSAVMGITLSVYAGGGTSCNVKDGGGNVIGYVTAWVDGMGCLQVSNDTDKRVTVTVTVSGRSPVVVTVRASETAIGGCDYSKNASVSRVENPICN